MCGDMSAWYDRTARKRWPGMATVCGKADYAGVEYKDAGRRLLYQLFTRGGTRCDEHQIRHGNISYNGLNGTLTGMSTCNEITTNTAASAAKSGDANVYLRASSADVGTQCWCSLTGPVTSWWVYYGAFDDEDACDAGCTSACAAAIKDNTSNFRTNGVYLAIW